MQSTGKFLYHFPAEHRFRMYERTASRSSILQQTFPEERLPGE